MATRWSDDAQGSAAMTRLPRVFSSHAVSVDGYVTGRGSDTGRGLGDGTVLFDWYFSGDTPSSIFDGFAMSAPSARVFDALAARVGAVVCGRTTYDDSGWAAGGTPHPNAPLVVLSHRPAPREHERQTFVAAGIEEAIAAAAALAGDRDVSLMGGDVTTQALHAGLVDEVVLHQVPVLLGGGRPFFASLPDHVGLRLTDAVVAPGVTHLHYDVVR